MERSVEWSDRPAPVPLPERPCAAAPWTGTEADEKGISLPLLLVLAGEVAAFAALAASGNMPEIVTVLYRALLTL